jgi:uncharacterized protein YuzE
VKLTYDRDVDAAYLMVVDSIAPGEAAHQVQVAEDENVAGQFILDFDSNGKLLGLEILFASGTLPPSVLAAAELR